MQDAECVCLMPKMSIEKVLEQGAGSSDHNITPASPTSTLFLKSYRLSNNGQLRLDKIIETCYSKLPSAIVAGFKWPARYYLE